MSSNLNPFTNFSIYESREFIYIVGGYGELKADVKVMTVKRPTNTIGSRTKSDNASLSLHLLNESFTMQSFHEYATENHLTLLYDHVSALIGFIKFSVSYYLYVVTEAVIVTTIQNKAIYMIKSTAYIPIHYKLRNTMDETKYRNIFNHIEFENNFYYSYQYPLMNSWQSNLLSSSHWSSLLSQTENQTSSIQHRFIWNGYSMQPFLHYAASKGISIEKKDSILSFIVPMIHGYCKEASISITRHHTGSSTLHKSEPSSTSSQSQQQHPKHKEQEQKEQKEQKEQQTEETVLKYILIGRRSIHFAGTRFLRRGVNDQGDVGNEVESEHLLIYQNNTKIITSYVQYRGSIPLCWHHTNFFAPVTGLELEHNHHNHHYQHPNDVSLAADGKKKRHSNYNNNNDYAMLHLHDLEQRYGHCIHIVNLVKQSISHREYIIYQAFTELCQSIQERQEYRFIEYYAFDLLRRLHAEDEQEISDAWNEFIERLTQFVIETGFCSKEYDGTEEGVSTVVGGGFEDDPQLQHGIIRTNCIDCLDRTNLGQYLAAKIAVQHQLTQVYQLTLTENEQYALDMIILQLWTEHGDRLALQYAGSTSMHRIEGSASTTSHNTTSQSSSTILSGLSEMVALPSYVSNLILNIRDDHNNNHNNTTAEEISNSNDDKKKEASSESPVLPSSSSTSSSSSSSSETASASNNNATRSGLKLVSDLAVNAFIGLQRYYYNLSTDFDKQYAIDLMLGRYIPTSTSSFASSVVTTASSHGSSSDVQTSSISHHPQLSPTSASSSSSLQQQQQPAIWDKDPYPENNRSTKEPSTQVCNHELVNFLRDHSKLWTYKP